MSGPLQPWLHVTDIPTDARWFRSMLSSKSWISTIGNIDLYGNTVYLLTCSVHAESHSDGPHGLPTHPAYLVPFRPADMKGTLEWSKDLKVWHDCAFQ